MSNDAVISQGSSAAAKPRRLSSHDTGKYYGCRKVNVRFLYSIEARFLEIREGAGVVIDINSA